MVMSVGSKGSAEWANGLATRYVHKASSESRSNTTTLANDSVLTISLDGGQAVYHVQAHLMVTGATAGDVKIAWAATGDVTQKTGRHSIGPAVGTGSGTNDTSVTARMTGAHSLTTSVGFGVDGTNGSPIVEDFLVNGGTNGGTLTLQWAQNTSNATATVMNSNSFLLVRKVEVA